MAMRPVSPVQVRPNTLHDETIPNVLRGEAPPNTLTTQTAGADLAMLRRSAARAKGQAPARTRPRIPGWVVLFAFVLAVIVVVLVLLPS